MEPYLIDIQKLDPGYTIAKSPEAEQCEILAFVRNTSRIYHSKKSALTGNEIATENQNFISKICAIGYLLTKYKDPKVPRAVSLIDNHIGRTGKSLFIQIIEHATSIHLYDWKLVNKKRYSCLWKDMNEDVRVVVIEDMNCDLSFYFPEISGDWICGPFGKYKCILPFKSSPKIILVPAVDIPIQNVSYGERIWQLSFSDYYNMNHQPIDEINHLYFVDWDKKQWLLYWRFLSDCIRLYATIGYVECPNIETKLI